MAALHFPPDPAFPVAPDRLLVVFAMRQEAGDRFEDVSSPVLYTGIGKVNTAYRFTKALLERRPAFVVDFGTVGSPRFPVHTVVECTRFVQRDMDVTPLGLPHGHTPLDRVPGPIDVPRRFTDLPAAVCGSGDHFVAGHDARDSEVVEMEAYALAKICLFEQVPFMAVKYVTDGADNVAQHDWAANLPLAAAAFRAAYDRLVGLAPA
jgi:adenosylhomocysteine nucleosidase